MKAFFFEKNLVENLRDGNLDLNFGERLCYEFSLFLVYFMAEVL
jgi:hypothetical protein